MRLVTVIALLAFFLASPVLAQYFRGPRGGCYTITRSGAKRYVDRSLCEETPAASSARAQASVAPEASTPRALHVRLADDQGRCFELYKDWSWAMVDPSRCSSAGTASANPSSGEPLPTAPSTAAVSGAPKAASESAAPRDGTKPYMTGPRGGCYTITPSGQKKYVPRTYCQ